MLTAAALLTTAGLLAGSAAIAAAAAANNNNNNNADYLTVLTSRDFVNALFVDPRRTHARRPSLAHDTHLPPLTYCHNVEISVETESNAAEAQRAVIARAITNYHAKTCVRFVPKTELDKDYVVISKIDGCYADFARVGGRQTVSLADECIDHATIVHELMHVIGFIHEHQRSDRDQFVEILWHNVIPGANGDFDKLSPLGLSYYGEKYDYFSIMHYESTEGSKNGHNTIEAKSTRYTQLMGKSTDFSRSDLNRLNRAYNCYAHLLKSAAAAGGRRYS